jgi:membrane fusion protein, multidrug efflux system
VTFTVPEQYLGDIKKYMAGGKLAAAASITNDPHPAIGSLTFVDNAVDRQTGTIKLKGTFENSDRRLWPGLYVNVTLTLGIEANAIAIPAQAVQDGQQGQFVFVVKKDMTVEPRLVKVNRTIGGQAVIADGVEAGETVVVDGQLRLTPGAKVDVKNSGPGADAAKRQG